MRIIVLHLHTSVSPSRKRPNFTSDDETREKKRAKTSLVPYSDSSSDDELKTDIEHSQTDDEPKNKPTI